MEKIGRISPQESKWQAEMPFPYTHLIVNDLLTPDLTGLNTNEVLVYAPRPYKGTQIESPEDYFETFIKGQELKLTQPSSIGSYHRPYSGISDYQFFLVRDKNGYEFMVEGCQVAKLID